VNNAYQKKISLFPLLLINFTGTLGYSIVLPFLVFLVTEFGGNAVVYGLLAATYPTFQLIGAPILGRWSDVYGRKKVLLLSHGGTLAGWVIFLVALYLPNETLIGINSATIGAMITVSLPIAVLFLARAIDGLTGGNVSVADAYISDISSDENRSKNFGKIAISSNLGFIVGPALAGILGATIYGETLPVLAALILSLVTLAVISLALKESKPSTVIEVSEKSGKSVGKVFAFECKECYEHSNPEKLKFLDVLNLKSIPFLLLLYFLIFLGFNIFYTSFPIHAISGLGWTISEMGIFFAVLSGMLVLVQGPMLRRALKKFSEEKLVIIGSVILGTNFVLLISNDIKLVYVAAVLFAIGNGLMWPSIMSILSKRAGTRYQGVVQGVASSFTSLASIIGLTTGGILYDLIGGTTFLISAGVIYIVFILSFRLLRLPPA
jgi:DHA1 family tetracycline resistance protein-like MFS transporter